MTERTFLDTNILLYAAGVLRHRHEDLQHQRAFDALVIENPFVS